MASIRFFPVLLFIAAGSLPAEIVSVGVKGGVPVTDAVEGFPTVHSEARPYTVGPTAQISLPHSFAVEVDALYKRIGYSVSGVSSTRVRANSWEFPMLLKYYLPGYRRPIRPYAEIGYVPRHLSGVTPAGTPVLRNDFTHGLALGGGLEYAAARLRIAPEFRYTHWNASAFGSFGFRGTAVRSTVNQAEFLLGVRF